MAEVDEWEEGTDEVALRWMNRRMCSLAASGDVCGLSAPGEPPVCRSKKMSANQRARLAGKRTDDIMLGQRLVMEQ